MNEMMMARWHAHGKHDARIRPTAASVDAVFAVDERRKLRVGLPKVVPV
jgi:hypothetical protein